MAMWDKIRNIHISKRLKIVLITVGALLLLLFIGFMFAKGWLLDKAVAKMQAKLKREYNVNLTFKNYELDGWRQVNMQGISCKTQKNDTLAFIDNVVVNVNPWPLLTGKLRLSNILVERGIVDIGLIKDLKGVNDVENVEKGDTTKFGKIKKYVYYLKEAAALVPDALTLGQVKLRYNDSVDNIEMYVDSMTYLKKQVKSTFIVALRGQKQLWTAEGFFNKNNLKSDLTLSTNSNRFYNFNFVKQLAKANVGFKSFKFKLDDLDEDDDLIEAKGSVSAQNVFVYNERLSQDTVVIPSGGLDFNVSFSPQQIELHNDSKVHLGEATANLKANYVYKGKESIGLNINMPKLKAQKVIDALPKGTFEQLQGMKIDGDLSYKLDFFLDLADKDSIHINSDPEGYNLKVLEYGQADLSKLNTSFSYIPYNSKKAIVVGKENPDFIPLDAVSPFLKNAILTSEDPSFFRHKGFVESAFETSFLENLKAGGFKRGGSTISMQLVKNVFLSHKKTIERKLEEMFIVWLIENMHISSKSRMFEVYLNIIEWGPNVYGVGPASHFYFSKHPSMLNLNESIFLAIIIPKPLAFAYRFDERGSLKDYVQRKMDFVARIMARRRLVSAEDTSNFSPDVYISGAARGYLKIKPDTLNVPEPEMDFNWDEILEINLLEKFDNWNEKRKEKKLERQQRRREKQQADKN